MSQAQSTVSRKPATLTTLQADFVAELLRNGMQAKDAAATAGIVLHDKAALGASYVYFLLDGQALFYVGKGVRDRMHKHLSDAKANRKSGYQKFKEIRRILDEGREPVPIVFQGGLSDVEATQLERALIQQIGRKNLTNQARGTYNKLLIAFDETQDFLRCIKPWAVWVGEERQRGREPTDADRRLYWLVVEGLEEERELLAGQIQHAV